MDLFAFICHSDPTKVRIRERELAKREVKLLKLTEGRTILLNPPVLPASGNSGDSVDKLFNEADNAEQEHSVGRDNDVLDENISKDVSSVVADTPVMTIAVTTTVAVDVSVVQVSKDKVGSENVKTFRDSASAGEANVNTASSLKLNEPPTSLDSFYASQDLDFETLHNIYVPKWKVTNDSVLDDPTADVSRSGSEDVNETYVGKKERLKDKTEAAEAVHLCSQLSIVEVADAAKSIELRDLKETNFALEGEKDALSDKVATLESMNTSKETELPSLTAQIAQLTSNLPGFQLSRDELSSGSSSLESSFELFKEHMEAMQDEQATILGNRSFEYLQALGQAISCAVNKGIQDGLKARVDHGKATRDMSKDASMVDLIDSLRLEGPLAEIPRAEDLQPGEIQEKRLSLTDVMVPFTKPLSSNSLIGEADTSATPEPITTLFMTFTSSGVVPPLSISNDQVLDTEPNDADPPAVNFEEEELATSPKFGAHTDPLGAENENVNEGDTVNELDELGGFESFRSCFRGVETSEKSELTMYLEEPKFLEKQRLMFYNIGKKNKQGTRDWLSWLVIY
nr:hypothetical protein [Tanacetum cinerariifolium]